MTLSRFFSDLTLDQPEFSHQLKMALRSILFQPRISQTIVMTGSGSNGKSALLKAIEHLRFNSLQCRRLSSDWMNWRYLDHFGIVNGVRIGAHTIIMVETEEEETVPLALLQQLDRFSCPCIIVAQRFTLPRDSNGQSIFPNLIHLEFPTTFVQSPTQPNQRQGNVHIVELFSHPTYTRDFLAAIQA